MKVEKPKSHETWTIIALLLLVVVCYVIHTTAIMADQIFLGILRRRLPYPNITELFLFISKWCYAVPLLVSGIAFWFHKTNKLERHALPVVFSVLTTALLLLLIAIYGVLAFFGGVTWEMGK